MISIDDFKKIEIRIGEVLSAEKVPETDKLLKLSVDFGLKSASGEQTGGAAPEREIRQIISGIAAFVPEPSYLVGKKLPFLTNLEPRVIKGLESNGMILAAGDAETFTLLSADPKTPPGTLVK